MIENSTLGLEIHIHVTVQIATLTDSAMTQQLRLSASVTPSDIHNVHIHVGSSWPWSASPTSNLHV